MNPDRVGDCFVFDFQSDMPCDARVQEYADYLVERYISEDAQFPPEMWAAQSSSLKLTTNGCESFHSHFNSNFHSHHPNIYIFLKVLKDVQTSTYIKINSIAFRHLENNKYKQVANYIDHKINDVNNNIISEYQFVKDLSYRYKKCK